MWIAHIRSGIPAFADFLNHDQVVMHPFVIGELACGQIQDRGTFLKRLRGMRSAPEATHAEALAFIQGRRIMSRGIGYGDVHLLAACKLGANTLLWTLDRRLAIVADELGVRFLPAEETN